MEASGGAVLAQDLGLFGPHWAGVGQVWHPDVCSRWLVELLLLSVARTAARGLQRGHMSFTCPSGSAGLEGPEREEGAMAEGGD
jgi:hypothetical protein